MHIKKLIIGLVILFSLLGVANASVPAALSSDEIQPPELPVGCGSLEVQTGDEVAFHAYAIGVQIYRWDGTGWAFLAPDAKFYADANYRGKVGIHYGGPTWESKSGSFVMATRINDCSPDATAIPWLLLRKTSSEGPGVFENVTYVQRVNTTGGLRPTDPGTFVGEEKRIPYTAEYYFYKPVIN